MSNIIEAEKSYDIDYIDQSGAGKYSQCPARYFFERILGLENQDRDTTAIDYGSDMHIIFPMCYGAKNSDEESQLLEKAMAKWRELRLTRILPETDKKHSLEHTEARIMNFIELHAEGVCPYKRVKFPFSTPDGARVISDNEMPFAIDVGGVLAFAGKLDLAVLLNNTEELFADDYKTASEISGRLWDCFDLNTQAIGYTLALSNISGKKVSGMMIEAVRKSTDKRKVETAIHYQYVTDQEIEFFLGYINYIAQSICNYNEEKKWPKILSNCSIYSATGIPSGNCPYKLLCKADDWRSVASFYHKREPFHPFKVNI